MTKRYRLVFRGELLAGYNPAEVYRSASQRFGADAQQLQRLFSGQAVTLKRALSIEAAARYARDLRQLGMRMHVERDADAIENGAAAVADCRIVFQGVLMAGFAPDDVKHAASERLHASPAQIALMFSGRKTVLKNGLDAQQAKRYAARLQSIGMQVAVESGIVAAPRPSAAKRASQASGSAQRHVETALTPLMRASDALHAIERRAPAEMDFTQTMVDHELIATNAQNALPDMEKTELAGEASLRAYMLGEPLPVRAAYEHISPPSPRAVSATATAHVTVASQASMLSSASDAQPPRICASCGARQTQGRNCIHCGHEFPRPPRPEYRASSVNDNVFPGVPTEIAHFADAKSVARPNRDRKLIYALVALASFLLLTWWFSTRMR